MTDPNTTISNDPEGFNKLLIAASAVTNILQAAALRRVDPDTLAKCDALLAGGGRVGVSVLTDRNGKLHLDLVGAEIEGRRVLLGEFS